MATEQDAKAVAQTWLIAFSRATAAQDAHAVAATFHPNGWLRDVLTFVWDTRSLRGRASIAEYLAGSHRLVDTQLANIVLESDPHYAPTTNIGVQPEVQAGFRYETRHALGRGYVRLVQGKDGTWLAQTLGMIVFDLKAHPEPVDVAAAWEADGRPWGELEAERRAGIESDPHVLIVGGGQCGLTIAARFRQMNIPTLVIEKNARIGDNWRERYQSLALHSHKDHHQLLYQPFPSNWPDYTPRDRVADWLEAYATNQYLVCWTQSTLAEPPKYDAATRTWAVTVSRAGTPVHLRPTHIVLATGTLGAPKTPSLPHHTEFRGSVLHATQYNRPAPFAGQHVAVVGAGNSSIDICSDLATGGAASVTMVQRSATCVVARESVLGDMRRSWAPGVPVEVGDLKFSSVPLGFVKEMNQKMPEVMWAREHELHEKLRKGGLKLTLGPENEGHFILLHERNGGYWLDKGGADLIASGAIKIKQGVSPTSFAPDGLVFSDGSHLRADVVIFATGYEMIRDVNKRLMGTDVIDQTCEAWGLDDEGEVQGCYRPTGHPGLWYALGDFFNCRFMSKQLAMLIKAAQLGLYVADTAVNDGAPSSAVSTARL